MIGRVVEIESEGCRQGRERGLMTVSRGGEDLGRVPLDDIGVLLCIARGLTYSNGLIVELANRGAATVQVLMFSYCLSVNIISFDSRVRLARNENPASSRSSEHFRAFFRQGVPTPAQSWFSIERESGRV